MENREDYEKLKKIEEKKGELKKKKLKQNLSSQNFYNDIKEALEPSIIHQKKNN